MTGATEPAERWLVVGHGSVGSFLAERLESDGARVFVYDPRPRVPVTHGEVLGDLAAAGGPLDFAVSCVPPEAAPAVPPLVQDALRPDGLVLDWNTLSPATKRRLGEASPVTVVDVALLDSLDTAVEAPMLAVSGPRAAEAAAVLERHGFSTAVAGAELGQAAALKYLRSIFMKSLEALVLEYVTLAAGVEGHELVRRTLEHNLGERFGRFLDLLVSTNRIHADRRSRELADAVETFASGGARPELAAADVLRRVAEAWREPGAPAPGAGVEALAGHLREIRRREPAAT